MILLPSLSSNLINWFIISINNLTQNPVLIYFSFRGRCHQGWIIYRWGFQFHLFFLLSFFRVVSPLTFFFIIISLPPPPIFFLAGKKNPITFILFHFYSFRSELSFFRSSPSHSPRLLVSPLLFLILLRVLSFALSLFLDSHRHLVLISTGRKCVSVRFRAQVISFLHKRCTVQ